MKSIITASAMTVSAALLLSACGTGAPPAPTSAPPAPPAPAAAEAPWVDSFDLGKCSLSPTGRNAHFILEPGYQLVLASDEEQVFITVLKETRAVDGIEARVVEEREFENGALKEISRNYFTICKEHGDVFYLGENVDDYKDGKLVGHGGAWLAGESGARAGLIMPGSPAAGYRHYQEIAPGVAMDRAEIVTLSAAVECPAGEFTGAMKVVETSELEPGSSSTKFYAPGVGLVFDDGMSLVETGVGRVPPKGPMTLPAGRSKSLSEVEVKPQDLPAPVASALKKLHPSGTVKEIKRESHGDGREIYAIEVMHGKEQHDVEIAPDGTVIRNEKE